MRAITFGDLARRPTIVGGHMFSLLRQVRAAQLRRDRPAVALLVDDAARRATADWDLSGRNLRSTRWLHKRVDVDFNGWFMCLIPRVVLEEIGLSLPLFIKWDDAEYGLRASAAGFPTVTFPGAGGLARAVDGQERRARLAGLLPRPQPVRVGAAALAVPARRPADPRGPQPHDRASGLDAVLHGRELRHQALEDVLAGPGGLHEMLPTRLAEVNALRKQFSDAQLEADREAFPEVRRKKPPRKGRDVVEVPGRLSAITAGLAPIRHLRAARELLAGVPRGRDPGHGRQVVPPGVLRLRGGVDERRHVRGALPARPAPSSASWSRDRRAAPAAGPRVAAAGGGVPRGAARGHLTGDVGGDLPPLDRPPTA